MDEEKVNALTRSQLRSYVVEHQRTGRRTGRTAYFERWKAEAAVKSALQKTKTKAVANTLKERGDETSFQIASGFAMLSDAGFKSIWDVARASSTDLLKVKGFGPARLRAIEKYLIDNAVELSWKAN